MNSESENEVGLFHSLVYPLGLAYSFVFFFHSFCDRSPPRLPHPKRRRRRGLIGGWCVRSADDDIETSTRSTDIGGPSTIVFSVDVVVVWTSHCYMMTEPSHLGLETEIWTRSYDNTGNLCALFTHGDESWTL